MLLTSFTVKKKKRKDPGQELDGEVRSRGFFFLLDERNTAMFAY